MTIAFQKPIGWKDTTTDDAEVTVDLVNYFGGTPIVEVGTSGTLLDGREWLVVGHGSQGYALHIWASQTPKDIELLFLPPEATAALAIFNGN